MSKADHHEYGQGDHSTRDQGGSRLREWGDEHRQAREHCHPGDCCKGLLQRCVQRQGPASGPGVFVMLDGFRPPFILFVPGPGFLPAGATLLASPVDLSLTGNYLTGN